MNVVDNMNVVDRLYQDIQRIHRASSKDSLAGIPEGASVALEGKLRELFCSRKMATQEAVREVYEQYGGKV